MSHIQIGGAAAALGRYPGNILLRVLDVAGLAMDAILIVDPEVRVITIAIVEDLKYPCRAITLRGLIKERQVDPDRNGRVGQPQVMRLILCMVSVGNEHGGEPIEADHPIRLRIDNLGALVGWLQAFMISFVMVQSPRSQI